MTNSGSSRYSVRNLAAADAAAWDGYVEAHPQGTFFHLSAWAGIVSKVFGHRPHYLLAADSATGEIRGVLPLAHVKSLLFGNALVSTPFCVYGGILADDDAARDALLERARQLLREVGAAYLELRHRTPSGLSLPAKDLYVTFRKPIEGDDDAIMKSVPRKQRAMIRKGIDAGLVAEESDDVDGFYDIYSESVRNLGTPVFTRRYTRELKAVFGERCRILMIRHEGRYVAGVMSFYFRDEVLPYYGGGTSAARQLKANDFMYFELMRRSAAEGIEIFDFGRSKQGAGSFSFKKHWGFEPEPLSYEYDLVGVDAIPNISPTNKKYELLVDCWKRLPLPLTRLIGPPIARSLG